MNEYYIFVCVILIFLCCMIYYFGIYLPKKKLTRIERDNILAQPKSRDIDLDIKNWCKRYEVGEISAAEETPLSYIGYKVGKTSGLNKMRRYDRLEYCFRMEIPEELLDQSRAWGRPATGIRFRKIYRHLKMLADQRRNRENYCVAVSEWDEDRHWFESKYREQADRFNSYGL